MQNRRQRGNGASFNTHQRNKQNSVDKATLYKAEKNKTTNF